MDVDTTRIWSFRVTANSADVLPGETLCLTGDCSSLGNWKPENVVPLTDVDGVWTKDISLPSDIKQVKYRYCVCVLPNAGVPLVRRWETGIPNRIANCGSSIRDEFGYISAKTGKKVDRGWLVGDSLVQFRVTNKPELFGCGRRKEIKSLSFKLLAVAGDLSECDAGNTRDREQDNAVLIEVAKIRPGESIFRRQDQFGTVLEDGDMIIFSVSVPVEAVDIAYLLDVYESDGSSIPRHLGYGCILPQALSGSQGRLCLPLTSPSTSRPAGLLNLQYLMIHPLKNSPCDMSVSYSSHWSSTWTGLDVGHRGSGSSFKATETTLIRENTLASLKTAAANGADCLEFDVQLSKDLVPVVYHDFHVCIAPKKKKQIDYSEMLEIPMKDLTLDQLHKLKVYHVFEGRNNAQRFHDEDLADHQPFPLLSEVLEAIDQSVGFNIEIKWDLQREDGTSDLQHSIDLNLYIDKILEVVLSAKTKRLIFFSCFHPDVCTALRMKQNLYPTMFLTQGITLRYPKLLDVRCNSIEAAVLHALNANLLGIVVHTEELLQNPSLIKVAKDAGLIIFCWGEDNNNKDMIAHLKRLGLNGIIYDQLDQYNSKPVKESIFLMEAQEAKKLLIETNGEAIIDCSQTPQ